MGSTTAFGGTSFGSSGNILNLAAGGGRHHAARQRPPTWCSAVARSRPAGDHRQPQHAGPLPRVRHQANILSTPNLVTLDNEEAKIVVGRNVPFRHRLLRQHRHHHHGRQPFTTIERRTSASPLKVKPQISEGGTVRLQIYQEASAVVKAPPPRRHPGDHQAQHQIHRAGGRRRG